MDSTQYYEIMQKYLEIYNTIQVAVINITNYKCDLELYIYQNPVTYYFSVNLQLSLINVILKGSTVCDLSNKVLLMRWPQSEV